MESIQKAATAIILNNHGHILLLERFFDDRTNTGWCLPGGKLDDGETSLDALRRELKEEIGFIGYDYTYHKSYTSRIANRDTFQIDVFRVKLDVINIKLNTEEFNSYGWFNLNHLPVLAGNTKTALYGL